LQDALPKKSIAEQQKVNEMEYRPKAAENKMVKTLRGRGRGTGCGGTKCGKKEKQDG